MKKILLVLHQVSSKPGLVGNLLQQRGYQLDIRVPGDRIQLPTSLDDHEAIVSFGGPMSANDRETSPPIRMELDWIPVALNSGKPFLGICLGAQLLARALGATVATHPDEKVEIGYYPVMPTDAGRLYFDSTLHFYHWNREGFELPVGAVKLASGDVFPNQAFRYGQNAYGVQFHPEMSQSFLEGWAQTYATDPATLKQLAQPGAQSWEEQVQKGLRYAPTVEKWLDRFLSLWLEEEAHI